MELFIAGFNSFASLINSAIILAQKTLEKYSDSGLGFGVYLNLIAPPAFLATKPGEAWIKLDRGGFEGFITRLQASIDDPTDTNRPTFIDIDYVGGWVVLLDTESIDEVWSGLAQLAGLFDFVNLFKLNLAPPAPQSFKGFCSYFVDNSKGLATQIANVDANNKGRIARAEDFLKNKIIPPKFGVKLEWDNNYISSAYLISRSKYRGGVPKEVSYLPLTLLDSKTTGDPGLMTLAKDMFISMFNDMDVKLPTKVIYEYNDPTFNSDKPKLIKAVPGLTVSFIDYDMDENNTNRLEYYYIIQACDTFGLTKGPPSPELVVTIKKCNDMYSQADVIEHPNGALEFISYGHGSVGSWASLKADVMIPWVKEFIGFIKDNLLGTLKGLTTSASDSFSKFINEIKDKIQLYVNVINVLSYVLNSFKNFILGPQILMLNLKPTQGGMATFVNRIRNAKLPEGDPGLSGANGISIGFVVTYGVSGSVVPNVDAKAQLAASEAKVAQLKAEAEALKIQIQETKTGQAEGVQKAIELATAEIELAKAKIAAVAQDVTEAAAKVKITAMGKAFDFITGLFANPRAKLTTVAQATAKKIVNTIT